ncbi:DMT family transporter [Leeia sp. TBRC 13508]|uniref:DMT family transporter n=1 Tax=Leeia speluncae TaxID=2884804 RepID=A0ABS8D6C4_9NEIS|nr:DMT family transporter [Leeia speluncae]MCB6183521.1 DMT family transporter [Leeia speluncae]
MSKTKPIDLFAVGIMIVLCMIWGFQQITLKWTALDISPMMQVSLRSGMSAIFVLILISIKKEGFHFLRSTWQAGIAAGLLFALEFVLVTEGLRFTTASHMVVFLYTAPIFAALGLHLLDPNERLGMLEWVGIAIAFCGLAIAFLMRKNGNTQFPNMLLGDLLGLIGGMTWGATTIVVRTTKLARLPATQTLVYQLIVGFLLLGFLAWTSEQSTVHWTMPVVASLLFQSIVVSFVSFLTWFWLLRQYPASRLGVIALMTPIFGVLFGVALLNEVVEKSFIIGAGLVIFGIVLVSGADWFYQLFNQNQSIKKKVGTESP